MQTRGIDVSHWQGVVDWFAVAKSEIGFAFIKATEGSSVVDAQFSRNWSAAREVGLFRGAYHFGRPGRDPEAQAAHFVATVGALGFRDLPPVLDLEEADGHGAKHVVQWAEAFVRRAEVLCGRRLLIYTGGFWRFQLGNPDIPFFRERALWLAAYSQKPMVPASWRDWTFWQYSDGTHNGPVPIPGIPGPVDQNLFRGGEPELDALCASGNSSVPTTTPPPPDDPYTWPGVHFIWPKAPPVAGAPVRLFQTRLTGHGFPVQIDGVYGPQTRAACRAFQRERGLGVDGVVGPKTWDACIRE